MLVLYEQWLQREFNHILCVKSKVKRPPPSVHIIPSFPPFQLWNMILGVATRVCSSAAPPGDESTPAPAGRENNNNNNNNNPTRDRRQNTVDSSAPTNEEGSPEANNSLKGTINIS